ncbi:unnamed protein product [Prorocentrum cordatum]|uniref:Uncharacterized protein n=1 Tax=Prorocentrum cordatum TaxID=2364126 RepID=A0ABN9SJ53_9DINO|nr:unnamed protein product [Polarella glacialis]
MGQDEEDDKFKRSSGSAGPVDSMPASSSAQPFPFAKSMLGVIDEADEAEVDDLVVATGDFDPRDVRGDWPVIYPFTKNDADFKLRLRRRESEKITVVDLKQGQGAFAQLVQLSDNAMKDRCQLYGCENPKAASMKILQWSFEIFCSQKATEKIMATKIKNDQLVLLANTDSQLPR